MLKSQKGGFTLLEVVICIIMIAILSFFGISYYQQALETIRRSDVISLLGVEITAQDRYRLTKGHYTRYWHELDAAPVKLRHAKVDNPYANGRENTIYYSRGKNSAGEPNRGFAVYFQQIGQKWFMVADRVGPDNIKYTLVRPFESDNFVCLPQNQREDSIAACLNAMGVDDASQLPKDPRISMDSVDDSFFTDEQ